MNTTLDQWEVLEAVVQLGSFAAAASMMNRSQSTISYAIAHLQEQFKVPLLEMKGRKAQLTEAGKALLADVEPLLSGFRALEKKAASLADSGALQIRLSIDSLYPNERLFAAVAELTRTFPYVIPRVHKGPFLSPAQEFTTFGADLCITGLHAREHFIKPILDIRMRAVACAQHPLHAGTRQLTRTDLIQRLAVIIEGTVGHETTSQSHVSSQRTLTVNTFEAAIEAVRSGMCFGWLPVYRIEHLLQSGELVPLRMPVGGERFVRLFLVTKDVDSLSRERNYMSDLLGAQREIEVI